jgi:MFS transporter, MHS family, proline/betaine transporter
MRYASSIASSSLGNILEWYDFGLFTIFSSLFARLFFPNEDPKVALLATISIFAIGFFCRPLGALLFGYLGDKQGRARTLRLSILMISLPTLLIGLIPTYQQIGMAAPVLLTLIRMWQGISIGGEYSGNLIYLAEIAPNRLRATLTSFASMGANTGILLAAFVGIVTTQFMTNQTLESWGWRAPYLISGLLSVMIYKFRLRIHETLVFEYLKNKNRLTKNPITLVFKKNLFELLRTLGLVCMGSTFYYFCFIFLPIFLTQNLNFSLQKISALMSLFIGLMIVLVPCAGYLCDQLGRRKMLLFNSFLVTLIVVPGFYFLQYHSFTILICVLTLFTIASSLEQGTTSISVVENFPPPARYTGLSLAYNIGNGFLGGTVPLICVWLSTHALLKVAPALYIAFCAAITACVVLFFVPETRNKSLVSMDR